MLDVIITSSCRKTIEKTIESFLSNVFCAEKFHFIVHIDVLDPHYLNREKKYLREAEIRSGNKIDLVINTSLSENFQNNFGKAMNYLHGRIKTKFYFNLQDDWVFLKKINLDPLIKIMEEHSGIDHIRFSKEKIKEKSWLYHLSEEISDEYLVPNIELEIDGISLVHTQTWSFNPSLVRTSTVKKFINIPEGARAETYICKNYPSMFNRQGTYIYGKIGDPRLVMDIGRNKIRNRLRKIKYIITGGKYADYLFGD